MNLNDVFGNQINQLLESCDSTVDAIAIIRRKPFTICENDEVERIVHLSVEGDVLNKNYKTTIRMDAHVVGIIKLKKSIISSKIPFVGDVVTAGYADISALTENSRVKIIDVKNDHILLEREVSIPERAVIRLMDLEQVNGFVQDVCKCCGEIKSVPMFHGKPGYCYECNNNIIKPRKVRFGALLQGLLNSGMVFEEDHEPRVFRQNQIDSITKTDGKLIATINGEEIQVYRNYRKNEYHEILDRKSISSNVQHDGNTYRLGKKTYHIKILDWAKGLATKIKELRVDRKIFERAEDYQGTFIDLDCFGDKTLLHMRRMFNIAQAKKMMGSWIKTEKEALEAVEKAEMIMNQPDCSRKLQMIISNQLQYAATKLHIADNFESELAQRVVGILTSIEVGLQNTSEGHIEKSY